MKDVGAAGERSVEGMADGVGAEGGEADGDGDGRATEVRGAEAAADHFGELEKVALNFVAGFGVVFEGHGMADRFRIGSTVGGDNRRIIAAEGGVVEPGADDTEVALEEIERDALEGAAGADAALVEEGSDARADAADVTDGDVFEPVGEVFWFDDDEAVWFLLFSGEFGEEFVRSDADGAGKIEGGFDVVFDHASDAFGGVEEVERAGDIEEGLVNGGDFNERGETFEHGHNGAGGVDVFIGIAADEMEVGAAFAGFMEECAGFNAGAFGGIGSGEDDGAFVGADDGDGAVAQSGVGSLFDGGEEGVHINVHDGTRWRFHKASIAYKCMYVKRGG